MSATRLKISYVKRPKSSRRLFRTRAPFGCATKRFESLGLHPELDPTTSSKRNKSNTGPGYYNPELCECYFKKCNVSSSWKRKAELEEFSKKLGFRNAHILKERQFQKSLGGPGSYDVCEDIFKRQGSSCLDNCGFGNERRFWSPFVNKVPGPGTYGKDVSKSSTVGRKQFSQHPTFERDGFIDRFKDCTPSYTKPPNIYNPVDRGSISVMLAKVVSKRGPYDCFTGPRDGTTIKNHFSPSIPSRTSDCFYTHPTDLEILLTHPRKQRYGCFLHEVRFGRATLRHMLNDLTQCNRDPNEPSPCHYNVAKSPEINQNPHPFNTSVEEVRPAIPWKIHPGVGRYSSKQTTCKKKSQPSWVFKSATGRTEYKAVEYNAFC